MIGIWQEEDGWHYRSDEKCEVRLPAASPPLKRLRDSFQDMAGADEHEVERVIVFTLGRVMLGAEPADGADVKQVIAETLSWGVAALALGGVRSSESDSRGAASPLALGEHAIAGHLDPSIDPAAANLARRHGLAGFRFSGDSWWTEDYLGAKEDPGAGQEQLEQIVEAESWPWLSLVVAVPASGAASEIGAIATGQALLGALVLLDQAPGTGWGQPVPWIAGGLSPAGEPRWPGDQSCDWTFPIQPQHVDATTRRLDNAENDIGDAPARLIDLAAHVRGPAGELLKAVVDSSVFDGRDDAPRNGHLADACRLAWLAAASETASTCWSLARSASEFLAPDDGALLALAQEGAEWRCRQEADWPERNGYGPDPNPDRWIAGLSETTDGLAGGLAVPSWGIEAARQSSRALGLAQALLFGHAARMQSVGSTHGD